MKKTMYFLLFLTLVSQSFAGVLHKPGEVIVKFRVEMRENLDFEIHDNKVSCGISSLDDVFKTYSINSYNQLIPNYDNSKNIDYALDMIYVFSAGSDDQAVTSVEAFERNPYVEYAELNIKMDKYDKVVEPSWDILHTPNDPYFSTYQWYLTRISAQAAWDTQTGNHGKIVAIIDDGCEKDHPDLQANYITGYDYVDNDNDPTPPTTADNHGTHCSGLAAAVANNGVGIASIGYGVGLIGVRTDYYTSTLAQGISFSCQNGANAISMSWGSSSPSSTIENAVNNAYNNYDIVCLASAGNDNVTTPHYPAYYSNVIAVAASNFNDVKAVFSQYGTWIDISAPGDSIYYDGILSTVPFGNYAWMPGTSMSCPLTAGLVTLMRCQFPSETNAQITTRLYNAADPMSGCSYYNAGQMGAGRINAQAAVSGSGPGGDTTELIYDDGTPENHYYWADGIIVGSRMTTPSGKNPYKLIIVKIHLGNTQSGSNTFYLKVFNWGGSQPGSELLSSTVTGTDNQWNLWNVSSSNITFNSNTDFLVGMEFFGGNLPTWGFDVSNNGRAWDYDGGWSLWNETYFMRAYVVNLGSGVIEEIGNDIIIESVELSVSGTLFTGSTTISYAVPTAGDVKLSIYDLSGREIRTLVNWHEESGLRHIIFDGKDNNGNGLPTGTYICNIITSTGSANTKLIIAE